jgi:hypothetical protein
VRVSNKFSKDSQGHFGAGYAPAAPVRSLLTMYAERPTEELTLSDFEVSALDRLAGGRGLLSLWVPRGAPALLGMGRWWAALKLGPVEGGMGRWGVACPMPCPPVV